jgi:glutamate N-acetyltransferase/amino-acid N-acetyltransferase
MKRLPRSPLAPARFPKLPDIAGVRLAACVAGVRGRRRDLMLAELAPGTSVAGVFTKSQTASAPVEWCRRIAGRGVARGLIVNSGNANAFTGYSGVRAVAATTAAVARGLNCRADEVFVSSTGVIGEELAVERITGAVPKLCHALGPRAWKAAAEAIRTTDTFAKGAFATCELAGAEVRINGIAKGSGMIAPDMGTMLGYVFTDAKLPARVLRALLKDAVATSFNAITVDSDTSPSDTVLLFATGMAPRRARVSDPRDPGLAAFRRALGGVMTDLAQQIARDGEGATKFVTVTVTGAASARAAKRIAMAIANSPLVKTAINGADPNWGRIVMAVGKAGERAERDALSIRFGAVEVARAGDVAPGYIEADAAKHMAGDEIDITVDVGVGRGRFTVWTCDFSAAYVAINADYRS